MGPFTQCLLVLAVWSFRYTGLKELYWSPNSGLLVPSPSLDPRLVRVGEGGSQPRGRVCLDRGGGPQWTGGERAGSILLFHPRVRP